MKLLATIYFATLALQAHGQSLVGAAAGNYAGVSSLEINPALAGDMPYNFQASLLRADAGIANNFLYLNMPYSPWKLLGHQPAAYTSNGDPTWDNAWVGAHAKGAIVNASAYARVMGPSFVAKQGLWVYGMQTSINTYARLSGLGADMAQAIYTNSNKGQAGAEALFNHQGKLNITANQQTYMALGMSLARRLMLIRNKELMLGVQYKFLHSMGGDHLAVKTSQISYEGLGSLNISAPNLVYERMYARNNRLNPHGPGGLDLGLVYIFRNREYLRKPGYAGLHPSYKFKFGASVLDIGNLVYTRTISTLVDPKIGNIEVPDINGVNPGNYQEQLRFLGTMPHPMPSQMVERVYGRRLNVGLPTRLVLSADWQLSKRFFVHGIYMQSLRWVDSRHLRMPSMISVVPRLEGKYMEISFPLLLQQDLRQMAYGMHIRFFNFFMGTRNLGSFLKPNGAYTANFYFGIDLADRPGKFYNRPTPYMFFKKHRCSKF